MPLSYTTDDGIGTRARLGLIVLQTDETIETEARPVFDTDGVALFHSRIANDQTVNAETLGAMKERLPASAALLPTTAPLDAIGYGCTSASTFIGSDAVAAMVNQTQPGTPVTDPIKAVIAACRALGIKRIGFLTPYSLAVSKAMHAVLEGAGFEIARFASFEQETDSLVARIATDAVLAGMVEVGGADDVDGVFASCTNLRTFSVLEQAEAALGKPVVSSNQALFWHMLSLAGVATKGRGPGRLFDLKP